MGIFFAPIRPDRLWGQSKTFQTVLGVLYMGLERLKLKADEPPPQKAIDFYECNSTSTVPLVFTARCLRTGQVNRTPDSVLGWKFLLVCASTCFHLPGMSDGSSQFSKNAQCRTGSESFLPILIRMGHYLGFRCGSLSVLILFLGPCTEWMWTVLPTFRKCNTCCLHLQEAASAFETSVKSSISTR